MLESAPCCEAEPTSSLSKRDTRRMLGSAAIDSAVALSISACKAQCTTPPASERGKMTYSEGGKGAHEVVDASREDELLLRATDEGLLVVIQTQLKVGDFAR